MAKIGLLVPHLQKDDRSTWLLYNLLDSIERYEPDLLKSTVICDDASPDFTNHDMKMIVSPYPVTLLRRPKNDGYSKNINMGLSFLQKNGCEYAVILNNDITLIQPFTPLFEYFKVIEGLAIIGPRLWYPNGRLQHGGLEVTSSQNVLHHGYGTFESGLNTRFVHAVTGAFQIVKLDVVGAYPEEYSLSYEDVAFCLRNWERGNLTLYTNSVSAIHAESVTRGYVCGKKEFESLTTFHHASFQLPEVDKRLRQAQVDYPHELLNTLLAHQAPEPYVRDSKKKLTQEVNSPVRHRSAKWVQVRTHRKLGPAVPLSSLPTVRRRTSLDIV